MAALMRAFLFNAAILPSVDGRRNYTPSISSLNHIFLSLWSLFQLLVMNAEPQATDKQQDRADSLQMQEVGFFSLSFFLSVNLQRLVSGSLLELLSLI